ncbi:MAG: Mycothiol S-conjugate amidase [Verrucomicrobia subdivision 3 bacterium]|nr:Mycothiol S-conjugate amidase [Limisphaerales bacterium]MCS1416819.1 Mycothiol S-conjugate amidase [Limisphaerales bacterium]
MLCSTLGVVSGASPKQGAELLKVDVMAVLAHPDDEMGMAAALASLSLIDGMTVANVYCTRGEGGGNMVGTHWGPSLGILREAELRDCLNRLGIRYCYFLEQRDWAYTESVNATLQAWGKDATLERLVRLVRALRPEIMLTMNPTPNPGQHGHHQSAAILATEAFEAAADSTRYASQITKEGLSVWQPRKLYCTGSLSEFGVQVEATGEVAGESLGKIVGEALSNHRSQGFGRMTGSPWLTRPRWFTLVKSVVPFRGEKSFFDALPVEGPTPPVLPSPAVSGEPPKRIMARLVPRPAITRYERWLEAFDLEHVAVELLPDIPVVTGESNKILIEVSNTLPKTQSCQVELGNSGEFTVEPPAIAREFPPGTTRVPFRVIPERAGSLELRVKAIANGRLVETSGRLHAVPVARVPRVATMPTVDQVAQDWTEIPALEIGPSQRVQGSIIDDMDSRALVRLGHDGQSIGVDIRVWDETVVSNIQRGDVRGHWRSDSVEICIDPNGGAEDTFACFKMGVFPFVEDLGARAARDADANQGPIEETAPTTRVTSVALEGGYRIFAVIPFTESGVDLSRKGPIGFNVIVYDGDKADAAPGENINQSRIAWSARSGVQGRPGDWGRIRFE